MKGMNAKIACASVCLVLTGCADLVVMDLAATGTAVTSGDRVEIPVQVVVRNQGTAAAGTFKVSTSYTSAAGSYVIPFSPTSGFAWYQSTTAPLAAGSDVVFDGNLVFTTSLHPSGSYAVRATADSCSGDEFMPSHCRVWESDESNNVSAPLTVTVP